MNVRPPYRWKSFWLEVLVLVFLGWAWVRSRHSAYAVDYEFRTGRQSLTLGSSGSRINLSWRAYSNGNRGLMHRTMLYQGSSSWFPEGLVIEERVTPRGSRRELSVAHWLVILLFFVPWLGFLWWRVRKRRRFIP